MIKKLILLFVLLSFGNTFAFQQLIEKNIDWHYVRVIQVILDGNHKVVSSLADEWKPLEYFVNKENWVSAVNWGYFCPKDYPNCGGKDYTNVPRFYEWKNFSRYGNDLSYNWVFAFDKNWNPFIVMNHLWGDAPEKLQHFKYNEDKISQIQYWIGNFPVLLLDGKNIVSWYEPLLNWKMKAKNTKNFICYTKDRKTIYMWNVSKISIYDLPEFIKKNFDCYGAINLDAGGSLWMVYNKKYVVKNSRPVMDAFVVVDYSQIKKKQQLISKYNKLINKVVNKLQAIKSSNLSKYNAIVDKIKYLAEKYQANFEISTILNEILVRLWE